MTEHIISVCVCSMHIELNFRLNVQSIVFECFSLDNQKRIKTVVRTRIDRCVFHDNENARF